MTVSITTNKVRLNGDGTTTSFPFQFPILKNDFSDLKVYRIDINEETEEETATLLSITTNYTVTVTKNLEQRITSGYINLINENNEPLALTENQALFIIREEEITQDLDLYENQKFPYKNVENMLDKIIVINQQQQEQIDRTLKTSSFFTGNLSETITSPVENRSLKWKKKQDGTFYVSNSDTDIDEIYNKTINNPNVITVANNINNVNINANNISSINAVAPSIASVNSVANNINALNSINNWINTSGGAVNYYIGQVIQILCSSNYIPNGCLPCDGQEYNKSQFPDLWNNYFISSATKLCTCTYEEYASDITTYGQCIKFAIDTENNKFKVPTIKDGSYITQAKSDTELGKSYNESLPNITASADVAQGSNRSYNATGAFYQTNDGNGGNWDSAATCKLRLDASRVSSTYQDGAKVQGDNVRLRFFVVVANGEINQSQMDWSAWATSLQGKANVDLNNINSSGQEVISHIVSPSVNYINLSVTAGQNNYGTAPADGYVVLQVTNCSHYRVWNNSVSTAFGIWNYQGSSMSYGSGFVPIAKGQQWGIYSGDGTITVARFYYLSGSINN